MKNLINKRTHSESSAVFRGMLTLVKGGVLARIVGLASIPFLTRIYSPEDFGVLALYTALVMIIAPMLTLRYAQAIPLPKTDTMAFSLFSVCSILILLGSLVTAITFLLFGDALLGMFNMQALIPWWPIIVMGVGGAALYELLSFWAIREKQYRTISTTQITQSLTGNATKVILGILAIKPAGLLVGQLVTQSAGVGSFLKQSLQSFRALAPSVSRKRLFFVIKYYRGFPYYRLPSQLLMILSVQAPMLMMASLYDREVTGQLSLAMMALSLPVSMIGSAVAKAYYAEIAALGKSNIKKIKSITFSMQKKLFAVGLPLMALTMLLASPFFALAFGNEWVVAGKFASMLAPFILFQFTSAPLIEVIGVVGRQKDFLVIHSLRIIGLACLFWFFYSIRLSVSHYVVAISAYLSVFYFFVSTFVFHLLRRRLHDCQ